MTLPEKPKEAYVTCQTGLCVVNTTSGEIIYMPPPTPKIVRDNFLPVNESTPKALLRNAIVFNSTGLPAMVFQ
jgi:hypothetical protein